MTRDDVATPDEWLVDDAEDEESEPEPSSPSEDPAEKYARSQLRVVRESKDYQLDYIQHAFRPGSGSIDVAPAYQRRLRWKLKQKSLLIESFLLNIPIPPIFMFERDYNEYEVIDGRQRLDAIRTFLNDEFQLRGLEYWQELNGSLFSELPQVIQRGLLRRSLPAVVLLAETQSENDDGLDVRHVLFDRLNTGGVGLNAQELRNALNPGNLNQLLIELARSDVFTKTWKIPSWHSSENTDPPIALLNNRLYSTFGDAELVLRFFALRDALQNKRSGSLRAILDGYMARNSNVQGEQISSMQEEYLSCLGILHDLFDGEPFRLPESKRLSIPLYDSLMIAVSTAPERARMTDSARIIRKNLQDALKSEQTYDVLVGRGNTMRAIRERAELAATILRSVR